MKILDIIYHSCFYILIFRFRKTKKEHSELHDSVCWYMSFLLSLSVFPIAFEVAYLVFKSDRFKTIILCGVLILLINYLFFIFLHRKYLNKFTVDNDSTIKNKKLYLSIIVFFAFTLICSVSSILMVAFLSGL